MFFSSFFNCILARLILAFTFNHFFGLMGLYWACMLAPFVSVPLGFWYERSNRWKRSVVVGQAEEKASCRLCPLRKRKKGENQIVTELTDEKPLDFAGESWYSNV